MSLLRIHIQPHTHTESSICPSSPIEKAVEKYFFLLTRKRALRIDESQLENISKSSVLPFHINTPCIHVCVHASVYFLFELLAYVFWPTTREGLAYESASSC